MLKETPAIPSTEILPELARAIVRTILYFDLFKYPLKAEEIWRSCDQQASQQAVQAMLDTLTANGMLELQDGYYRLSGSPSHIQRRCQGNALADARMKDAQRSARCIAAFPYVQGVMVSGSLSKNYMEPSSDVDFFVVTTPGRLWVARTLLILYKKVFLLNSHRNFCVNYFIDTQHLGIEDRNVFTATETVFLLPMVNGALYEQFRAANTWADACFPNFGLKSVSGCTELRHPLLRRLLEWSLNGKIGDSIDAWCLRRTLGRWKRKFSSFKADKFEVAMRTRKYVSKHHPSDFQAHVTARLSEKLLAFEQGHGVSLAPWSVPNPVPTP